VLAESGVVVFGRATGRPGPVQDAINGIMESVIERHGAVLARTEDDLFAELQEHLPTVPGAALLFAAEETIALERRRCRAQRIFIAEALSDAFATASPGERDREVNRVLEAESERLKFCAVSRLHRAVQLLSGYRDLVPVEVE
jgi:hypothetical protein